MTIDTSPGQPRPRTYDPPLVSWEDFHNWLDEDRRAEWVDGEIVAMAPSNDEHQRICGFLYVLLWTFVQRHRLGELFQAPFLMRLPHRPSGREPDLQFVSSEHAERVTRTYLDGPADLVVEVISPDSETRDRAEKFLEYEAAGIPEYWLLDEPRHEATFYVLGADGRYHPAPVDAEGVYASTVLPGLKLRVAWLWQRPLPTLDEVLAER